MPRGMAYALRGTFQGAGLRPCASQAICVATDTRSATARCVKNRPLWPRSYPSGVGASMLLNREAVCSILKSADITPLGYRLQTCNINMIFTGICHTNVSPPDAGLSVGCDAGGFFNDWWLTGSYFEFTSATCKFTDSFRRVIGLGAEIIVFIVQNVTPANTNGCSFASTHNWVVIEALPTDQAFVAAHEIGHACWLPHDGDPANLMNPITPAAIPTLTNVQIALVRWSKHCVYI